MKLDYITVRWKTSSHHSLHVGNRLASSSLETRVPHLELMSRIAKNMKASTSEQNWRETRVTSEHCLDMRTYHFGYGNNANI